MRFLQLLAFMVLTTYAAFADPPKQYAEELKAAQAAANLAEARPATSYHPSWLDWVSGKLGVTGCGPFEQDRLAMADNKDENQYNDACDLEAQESVANSTRWLLAVAGFQTLLGFLGTFLVWRSLRLTRDATNAATSANNIANEHFISENRPWININLVKYREIKRGENEGFYSQITLSLENNGKGVATNVRAFIRPYILVTNNQSPRHDAEKWLTDRIKVRNPEEVSMSIFPGETISSEPDLSMRNEDLTGPGEPPRRQFILQVAAMVEYTAAKIDGPRVTYTNFYVMASDAEGLSLQIDLDEGVVPMSSINVKKSGVGYAT